MNELKRGTRPGDVGKLCGQQLHCAANARGAGAGMVNCGVLRTRKSKIYILIVIINMYSFVVFVSTDALV